MRKGNQSSRACSLCRQKRTKCSGTQPCDRCIAHHEECSFHQQAHESKASLRTQIKELKKVEHDSQLIFDSLRGGKGSHAVLSALQQNVPLNDIASALSDPNGALALTDNNSGLGLSASSVLPQEPGQASSELGNVAASSTGLNLSPVSSTTTDSSSWMMSQGSISDMTGLPPLGHTGNTLNQVAPGYRYFYDGQIPPAQGQDYSASVGLMPLRNRPNVQWTGSFGFDPLACEDPTDA